MSQNRNGNGSKNFPQRKPYQPRQSPYRLNGQPNNRPDSYLPPEKLGRSPQPASRVRALRFPGLRKAKRAAEISEGPQDVDPRRRYLKDRLVDEIVLKLYRRSKWQILYLSLIPDVLTVITILGFLFSALVPLFNIIAIPLLVVTVAWWVWTIVDWENDYLIVTNKRFVHIEKVFLFEQTRDEIRSVDFTEVKLEARRGSIEFAFQIGTVIIQGKSGTITFNRLPKPDKVYQEIDNDYKERRKSRRKERDEYMDKYFMAKAGKKQPEMPPYSVDIPHLEERANIFAKIFLGKPTVSYDEIKRKQIIWRKHPFILVKVELMPIIFSIVYVIALLVVSPFLIGFGGLLVPLGIIITIVVAVVLLAIILYIYDDWQNDVYILNTEEVMDNEKSPFGFNEFKDRIKLVNVQEIQLVKTGFFSNIFNYGSVQVSRTGSNKPLTFTNIPNPDAVQMQIGRWKDTRAEIAESLEDQRTVDFLVRHRQHLHSLLEED